MNPQSSFFASGNPYHANPQSSFFASGNPYRDYSLFISFSGRRGRRPLRVMFFNRGVDLCDGSLSAGAREGKAPCRGSCRRQATEGVPCNIVLLLLRFEKVSFILDGTPSVTASRATSLPEGGFSAGASPRPTGMLSPPVYAPPVALSLQGCKHPRQSLLTVLQVGTSVI